LNAVVDKGIFVVILIVELQVERQVDKKRRTVFLFLGFIFPEGLIADLKLFGVRVDNSGGKGAHFVVLNFVVHLMIFSYDFLSHFGVEER
jgi:hypothetical protein